MDLENYLMEVQIEKDPSLSGILNAALARIFSFSFLNKINDIVKKQVRLKEVFDNDKNIVAYTKGKTLFVNKPTFSRLPRERQVDYILHEFVHLLQKRRKLLFFKSFQELDSLTNKLFEIVKRGLTRQFNIFLTGKNVDIGHGGKHEILAYLILGTIDLSALKPGAKFQFIEELKKSNLFNLKSSFWKKRLT